MFSKIKDAVLPYRPSTFVDRGGSIVSQAVMQPRDRKGSVEEDDEDDSESGPQHKLLTELETCGDGDDDEPSKYHNANISSPHSDQQHEDSHLAHTPLSNPDSISAPEDNLSIQPPTAAEFSANSTLLRSAGEPQEAPSLSIESYDQAAIQAILDQQLSADGIGYNSYQDQAATGQKRSASEANLDQEVEIVYSTAIHDYAGFRSDAAFEAFGFSTADGAVDSISVTGKRVIKMYGKTLMAAMDMVHKKDLLWQKGIAFLFTNGTDVNDFMISYADPIFKRGGQLHRISVDASYIVDVQVCSNCRICGTRPSYGTGYSDGEGAYRIVHQAALRGGSTEYCYANGRHFALQPKRVFVPRPKPYGTAVKASGDSEWVQFCGIGGGVFVSETKIKTCSFSDCKYCASVAGMDTYQNPYLHIKGEAPAWDYTNEEVLPKKKKAKKARGKARKLVTEDDGDLNVFDGFLTAENRRGVTKIDDMLKSFGY